MLRDPRQTFSSLNRIRATIVIGMSHTYRVCTGALYWVLSRGGFRERSKQWLRYWDEGGSRLLKGQCVCDTVRGVFSEDLCPS